MRLLIGLLGILLFPSFVHAKVIKWEGKPISVSISTERLTRIEFPENLRSVFLSRSDIAVEKEDRSLYVRALAPEVEDTLFVVGESGTAYEINLSTSDNPDQTIVISSIPKSLQAEAEQARQVPALDLMRSMMLEPACRWIRDPQRRLQSFSPTSLATDLQFTIAANVPAMSFTTETLVGANSSANPTVVATITLFGHLDHQSGSKRY